MQQATSPARARVWPYVLIFCLAFTGFMVALVPVNIVWERFGTPQMAVQPNGLQGTLWQGSADWIEWQTQSIQAVRWSFQPWGLLRGVWEYQVALQYEGVPVSGLVGTSLSGDIQGRDLQAQVLSQDMSALAYYAAIPATIQGDLQVDITKLVISGEWPDVLQGQLTLNSLELVGLAELGDWQGQLSQADNQHIRLQFAPVSDDRLQGEGLLTLTPDKAWELTLKIRPAQAESEIGALVDLLGTVDHQGYITLAQQGRWY